MKVFFHQRVIVDGKYSAWSSVTSGVPQHLVWNSMLHKILEAKSSDAVREGWILRL